MYRLAYLMYFRLIDNIHAPYEFSVTCLIQLFGIYRGGWFLDEQIGWHTLLLRQFISPEVLNHE